MEKVIMYAIADKYNEGCFYDAKKGGVSYGLEITGLFPAPEVAVMVAEDEGLDSFEVIDIEEIVIEKNGTFSYTSEDIWNEYCEECEEEE